MLALFLALFLGWGFSVRAMNVDDGHPYPLELKPDREQQPVDGNEIILSIKRFNRKYNHHEAESIDAKPEPIHHNNDASARARNQRPPVLVPEKSANNKGSECWI